MMRDIDHIAGFALMGILAGQGTRNRTPIGIAKEAYEMAEAFMKIKELREKEVAIGTGDKP